MLAIKSGTPLFKQKLGYDASGQITFQRSKQGSDPDREEYYTYDRTNRLTHWVENYTTLGEYEYDEVGNRTMLLKNNVPTTYSYLDPQGPNRLSSVIGAGNQVTNIYDKNGSLSKKNSSESVGSFLKKETERFRYSASGLVSQYRRGEVYVPTGACETIEPTISEDWRYRYSAGGEREQKREYAGTQGNDNNAGGSLGWTYYLLGADKKQLAVYHGIETRNACSNSDTLVYLYPVEYLSYGIGGISNIITKPDGSKEYKLQDHLGSTRVTLNGTGGIVSAIDYEPFGGVLKTTGTEPTAGFIDKPKDGENGLHVFGVRLYDEELPRFTSIDPLWEKLRDQSPYVYSHNNPLCLKDPSGLIDGAQADVENEKRTKAREDKLEKSNNDALKNLVKNSRLGQLYRATTLKAELGLQAKVIAGKTEATVNFISTDLKSGNKTSGVGLSFQSVGFSIGKTLSPTTPEYNKLTGLQNGNKNSLTVEGSISAGPFSWGIENIVERSENLATGVVTETSKQNSNTAINFEIGGGIFLVPTLIIDVEKLK